MLVLLLFMIYMHRIHDLCVCAASISFSTAGGVLNKLSGID